MADGYHGSMPSEVFKNLIINANPTSHALRFEVSRTNGYRNAGLYRGTQDDKQEFLMGVTMGEFPERTVRSADGGIEALGLREALTSLIMDRVIEPKEEIRTWLGIQAVVHALGKRKGEGIVASVTL